MEKVIIITLALDQQLALRPYGEDTTTLWVVPILGSKQEVERMVGYHREMG